MNTYFNEINSKPINSVNGKVLYKIPAGAMCGNGDLGVVFDNNNNIKEIELLASNYTNQNQRENVDVRNSFNYMLKYFSQRYSGMKKAEFNTKDDTSCLYEVGTEYVWNTPYLTIRVQLFNTVHNAIAHANKKSQLGDFCMDEWMRSGKFAKVKIILK